jgi:hypothetical protein
MEVGSSQKMMKVEPVEGHVGEEVPNSEQDARDTAFFSTLGLGQNVS